MSRGELLALVGVLGLVVAARLASLPAVYQGGHIVLTGNDTYFFRYLVDQGTLAGSYGFDKPPETVRSSGALFVWTAVTVSTMLGGTTRVASHVLAWYPIVTVVLSAVFLYVLSVLVTDDRRVAIAAVALLALPPGHAFHTSLRFADHHAFDYFWLAFARLAVTAVMRVPHDDNSWPAYSLPIGVLGVSVGVTGQLLAWEGGVLLLVPLVVVLSVLIGFSINMLILLTDHPKQKSIT